jgi:predicted small metal-binding protein
MSKVLRCREVGMDCDFEARGETENEVLAQAADHAHRDHGMTEIPDEVLTKVKAAIHEE